jgi:hypothetical protein
MFASKNCLGNEVAQNENIEIKQISVEKAN